MNSWTLELSNIICTFRQAEKNLEILKGINLKLNRGEVVALIGPSGAGKTTLLNIAGLLESPGSGTVTINGMDCTNLNDNAKTQVRRENLGFVYQYHHLLPEFSAIENITISQIIAGISKDEAIARANQILEWMGLSDRKDHRPSKLSGGEQQRIAIARAIATSPQLLLADEPTGNLDPDTGLEVCKVLIKLARGSGLTAFIATHNIELANRMDRIIRLDHGVLIE
ncbi:MAG: putative ABC transporter ATP-binding protein [Alphaproteobacteria bacterium MarineAlpha3_Bin5]|nr:MAG: putative ABC transporter ATP-binding protein [Alphaproteobacteria bacterium MarineAlpha3_Bin5]